MAGLWVGNDVVDLTDPRCAGKADSRRFLARVFAPDEAVRIRRSSTPDRTLWLLWAAKESAYKVVSKALGAPPPFVHAAFRVECQVTARRRVSGHVDYGVHAIPFLADVRPGSIHAVAWWSPAGHGPDATLPASLSWTVRSVAKALPGRGSSDLDELRVRAFTERERGAVHSVPSAAVRVAARAELARRLELPVQSLEIVCVGGQLGRTPPRVLVEGGPADVDVSLSHHHDLVAWVTRVG